MITRRMGSEFTVTYDGPSIVDGRMAVRDLAPALLALGEIFQEANEVTNPGSPSVSLEIQATAPSSFEVTLHLAEQLPHVVQQVVNLLTSQQAQAIERLIVLVSGGTGLFAFIRNAGNKEIVDQEAVSNGAVRVTFADGTSVESPASVPMLYERQSVREASRAFVQPLHADGINQIKIQSPRDEPLVLTRDDVDAFDVPPIPDPTPTEDDMDMSVRIISPSFAEGNKWRLAYGVLYFWATIEDNEFLDSVKSGKEAFRDGDLLECRMRIRQSETEDATKIRYTVLQVYEHQHSGHANSLPLPLDFGESDDLGN